jgi:hypothetical protein
LQNVHKCCEHMRPLSATLNELLVLFMETEL